MLHYLIRNEVSGDYWNDKLGWCDDINQATFYTEAQTNRCLPIEGYWIVT